MNIPVLPHNLHALAVCATSSALTLIASRSPKAPPFYQPIEAVVGLLLQPTLPNPAHPALPLRRRLPQRMPPDAPARTLADTSPKAAHRRGSLPETIRHVPRRLARPQAPGRRLRSQNARQRRAGKLDPRLPDRRPRMPVGNRSRPLPGQRPGPSQSDWRLTAVE